MPRQDAPETRQDAILGIVDALNDAQALDLPVTPPRGLFRGRVCGVNGRCCRMARQRLPMPHALRTSQDARRRVVDAPDGQLRQIACHRLSSSGERARPGRASSVRAVC